MICAAAAFISVSSFEEVLDSTKLRLMKTRFRLAHQQLYVETAMLI
jgi:ribosomal protein L29